MTKNCQNDGSPNRDLLTFLYRYGIFQMPPGESSCPAGSEYVWQGGYTVFQAELRAAKVYPIFKKTAVNAVLKKTDTVTIFKISLPKRISVGSFILEAIF